VNITLTIQHDASGQGHAWRTVDAEDLAPSILEEIHAEFIELAYQGDEPDEGEYVATNGQHYRWRKDEDQ